MDLIYLHSHEEDGAMYLVNPAYIVAVVRGTEEDYTTVFIDSKEDELKELWVKELPEGIRKMLRE